MTQDEIIEMARQAQLMSEYDESSPWVENHEITEYVTAFAKLVYDRGWMNGYTSCDNDNKALTSALIKDAVQDEREELVDLVSFYGGNVYDIQTALRARNAQECCGNPFKCKGNCVDKETP